MIHKENTNIYKAESGKTIARKADGVIMGTGICLGINDSIDNYEEVNLPEEEKVEPTKRHHRTRK